MNSQKIKQKLVDLLGPKNPTTGKFILNPVFNLLRKMSWENSKKTASLSWWKRRRSNLGN